jgi:hypothetical protein
MTSAARAGAAARVARNASRSRRRARLRWTALRSCRLTANPTRVGSSVSRQSTMSAGRSIRLPFRKSAWKSALVVSRCRRESWPVRRSAVSGPSRDAASAPCVRPSSSCARGSRASSPVGADWVETSASSSSSPFRSLNRYSVGTREERVNQRTRARRETPTHERPCDVSKPCASVRAPLLGSREVRFLIDGCPGTDGQIILSDKALRAIHTCG